MLELNWSSKSGSCLTFHLAMAHEQSTPHRRSAVIPIQTNSAIVRMVPDVPLLPDYRISRYVLISHGRHINSESPRFILVHKALQRQTIRVWTSRWDPLLRPEAPAKAQVLPPRDQVHWYHGMTNSYLSHCSMCQGYFLCNPYSRRTSSLWDTFNLVPATLDQFNSNVGIKGDSKYELIVFMQNPML